MSAPLIPDKDSDLNGPAHILRLLSHPMRLSIALLLLAGPQTVSFIESHLGLKQPNLSQHLAILRDANVLTSSRKAKSVTYEIHPGLAQRILAALAQALTNTDVAPAGGIPPQTPSSPLTHPVSAPSAIHAEEGEALVFATIHYPNRKP